MTNISLLMDTAERLASQFNSRQIRLATFDTQLVCKAEYDDVQGAQLVFCSVGFRSILEPEKIFDFLALNAPNLSTIIRYSESLDKCLIIAF